MFARSTCADPRGGLPIQTLLLSTSSLWNCGDEFIRKGVLDLLRLRPEVRTLWWNRGYGIIPRFANDLSLNLRHSDYVLIAGTPEWVERNETVYRYCLQHDLPLSLIGVGVSGGATRRSQFKLMHKLARSGLVELCLARDTIALDLLHRWGFEHAQLMPDPAFFMESDPATPQYNLVCWRDLALPTTTSRTMALARRTKARLRGDARIKRAFDHVLLNTFRTMPAPKLVLVHDNREISQAEQLFGNEHVFYSTDYREMLRIYSHAKCCIGGRIHGAIAAAAHGAGGTLLYPNNKASTAEQSVQLLSEHDPRLGSWLRTRYLREETPAARELMPPTPSPDPAAAIDAQRDHLRNLIGKTKTLRCYVEPEPQRAPSAHALRSSSPVAPAVKR